MNSEDPAAYACTLDLEGARARLPNIRALTGRLLARERIDNRLVLRFEDDGDTTALVEEFVREEQACCPFFGFEIRHGQEVALELSAPAEGSHMLDAAMDSFDPDRQDDARLAAFRQAAAGGQDGDS